MYASIMSWTQENRVAKYAPFQTEVEALEHIAAHVSNYPDAFVVQPVNNDVEAWLVDPVAKTISISIPQERIDREALEAERQALKEDAIVQTIETYLSTHTGAEIKAKYDSLTRAEKDNWFAGMLVREAAKLR